MGRKAIYASNAEKQSAYRDRKRNVTPGDENVTRKRIALDLSKNITEVTENVFIMALRCYYQQNFRNGDSDESFLLWLEGKLSELKEGETS